MSPADPAKRLASLLKRLRSAHPDARFEPAGALSPMPEWADPMLEEFLLSFLMWESTLSRARTALRRLRECVVDYNELRVCLSHELAELVGERYPRAAERADRLHAALTDLYKREHAMSLSRLADAPKRDALQYLSSLEGVPPYVAARVFLVALGGHAIPVDERLLAQFKAERVVEQSSGVESCSSWIERHVRAPDAVTTHCLLQAWADEGTPRKEKKPDRPPAEKPAAKAKSKRQKAEP